MMVVYRSIALTGKDFITYLEYYDLKNLKIQIDIQENEQTGKVFKPISDNFIIVSCESHLRFHRYTHVVYDFDNKTRLGITAFTNKEGERIEIIPEQIEDFAAEFNSVEFIDTLLPAETEGKICFWGSKLGIISTLTTIDFSVKWQVYRESMSGWLKEYFPVNGLSENFERSLTLLSDICSYDKEFLLQLSRYKVDLIFKGVADLNTINKAFGSIERLPENKIESAKKQKEFIDTNEALISETEDSLQNIYLSLNMLKVTSKKGNKFMNGLKNIIPSYIIGKIIDITSSSVGWLQDRWQFVVSIFEKIKFWLLL